MESVKLLAVFIAIIAALRLRLSAGPALFGAGLLTALLFQVSPEQAIDAYTELLISHRFISLTGIVVLITIMGSLLTELGYLERLTEISRGLVGGKRTAAASLPVLVGLMPMPGGSLLSAPLVDNILAEERYQPHFKCLVNYWSRHAVEHFMPIYPGIIVSAAVTGMPIGTISLMQLPLGLAMFVIGLVFFVRHIDGKRIKAESLGRSLTQILFCLWPILLTIAIYAFIKIDLSWGALIALVALILVARPDSDKLRRAIRSGLNFKIVFLVFGILSFQALLDLSGAVQSIQSLATKYHLSDELVIFAVAFTSGLMTGMLAALIALSYSLLAGFLYQPEIVPANILWAFICGYTGMMLSPTHLCLTLTNDYFGSDLLKVLKNLVLPLLLLLIAGYMLAHSGWPELFAGH